MVRLRLHVVLADKRFNQKELGKATGIDQNIIDSYCNEKTNIIPLEHIDILCKTLKCSVQDIIQYTEEVDNLIDRINDEEFWNSVWT